MNSQEKKNDDKLSNETGKPRIIVLKKSSNYNLSQSKSLLKQELKLTPNDDFRILKTESDNLGFTHQKQQQYYKNLKVEFGSYNLHAKSGRVASLNGEYYAIEALDIRPKLSKQAAFQRALSHTGAEKYLWEYPEASKEMDNYKKPEGELLIVPGEVIGKKEPRLAYKFDIYATKPLSRGYLYIDAVNGEALFFNAIIKHATTFGHVGNINKSPKINKKKFLESMLVSGSADTRYSGTRTIETTLSGGVYTLNDATRKVYTRDAKNQAPGNTYPYISNYDEFTDNDNNWTSAEHSANKDDAALDAHWGAMKTYDYFNSVHNRNSYDGNGAQIRSYVHVDSNYDNAFWNGSVMSYGDGSSNGTEGNGFFDALTSIDVAAHEIGHAVCSNTADLAYQRESGGLNEGFSDIWGAAVEHFAKGNGNDANPDATIWLIGDEIDRRNGSAALRSMSNPTSLGQPDTYGGTNWINPQCGTPTRTNDYCGVHTNSGVLNYWFYILTVGGSGTNDIGNAFNVSGIGMSKAANISYRLEATYLSANSTFQNARDGAIQAATDLYGANGAEVIAVTNAWHAVGVGSAYGQTSYCDSKGNSVNDEYIGRVQLGAIDNTSNGNNGYTDHTAVSTDLVKGSTTTITVTPTWTGTLYNEGYSVWIDYNQDGDFEDAGEQIFTAAASQNTPITGTFTVPSSATDGATRMRVSMKYNGIPTACETFSYGEVEDYTVNIGASGSGDTQAPSAPTSLVASAITETTATLSWTASTDNVAVTGYDVYQGTTSLGTVTGTSANITGLTANTSYTFSVKAKDAAGNESAVSNSVTFTTGTVADTQAPSAPSSLVASNTTQTTVDLSWAAATDNIGVTAYDVFQGSTIVGSVTGTSTTITGLTANTAYSFYVIAKDAAGNNSSASNTVNVTTSANTGGSSQVLFDGSFETGWEGWIDGGSDSFRYSGSRSYDGNYSIRLRDNSGTASSMTLGSFNVSSYDNIEIVFYFYANSMENGEDFWVQYNDGSGWSTVASYARGTNFNNNTFYSATVNVSSTDYAFSSNAQFRFRCDASANGDQVYIDKVKITATSNGGNFTPNSIADLGGSESGIVGFDSSPNLEIDGLQVSPNPASNTATLKAELDLEDESAVNVELHIYNIQGRLIRTKKWENIGNSFFERNINISKLPTGVYFINVQSSNGFTQTQKLIVR